MMRWSSLKYIIGLSVLIAAAFLLPRFLFDMQDRGLLHEVGRGKRQDVNLDALTENYEMSVRARLAEFAEGCKGGKDYYVSEVAAELSEEEQRKILQNAFSGNASEILNLAEAAWGNYTHYAWDIWLNQIGQETGVTDWKKYVIYDATKVYLICWYVDIQLDDMRKVRALLDAEDGTIYYLQGSRNILSSEYESTQASLGQEKAGHTYWDGEMISMLWLTTVLEYGADWEYGDILPEETIRESISDGVSAGLQRLEKQLAKQNMDLMLDQFVSAIWQEIRVAENEVWYLLHYGESLLEFEILYEGWDDPDDGDGRKLSSVGIKEIARLIPEIREKEKY